MNLSFLLFMGWKIKMFILLYNIHKINKIESKYSMNVVEQQV